MMSVAYDLTPKSAAAGFLNKPQGLLIDGQRVASASGRMFKSLNPATDRSLPPLRKATMPMSIVP